MYGRQGMTQHVGQESKINTECEHPGFSVRFVSRAISATVESSWIELTYNSNRHENVAELVCHINLGCPPTRDCESFLPHCSQNEPARALSTGRGPARSLVLGRLRAVGDTSAEGCTRHGRRWQHTACDSGQGEVEGLSQWCVSELKPHWSWQEDRVCTKWTAENAARRQ